MSISTQTCQAVIDGFNESDFTGWDVWGKAEDARFCIGLNDDLALTYDPRKPAPFTLEVRGMEFPVRDVEWRWDLTISLDGWNAVVRRTT